MFPLLTIAIPTYQRKHWLQRNLAAILNQMRELPPGLVEIVVSENAGADGTWEYLQELATENSVLRLNRNRANIGGEANFYLLPSLSSGTYIWLLGDDDFLEPGALREIIAELQKAPDYVVLNFANSDESLTQEGKPCWTLDANKRVSSVRECCKYVPHFAMGFLSAWIARKEFFNLIDKETYKHFSKWGLAIMADRYLGVASSKTGLIMAKSMLVTRKPTTNEQAPGFDYFLFFFEGSAVVFRFLHETIRFDRQIVQARKAWLLRKVAIKRILYERGAGILDARKINSILFSGYRDRWEYWFGCLPVLYFPGLGLLATMVQRLKSHRQRKIA